MAATIVRAAGFALAAAMLAMALKQEKSQLALCLTLAAGAMLLVGAAVGLMLLLRKKRHRFTQIYKKTERALFRQFERAAASNTAEETMRALTRWFDAAGHPDGCDSLSEFVATFGDPTLQNQFYALEASIFGKQHECWSGKILFRQFSVARKKYLCRSLRVVSRQVLGPLNP